MFLIRCNISYFSSGFAAGESVRSILAWVLRGGDKELSGDPEKLIRYIIQSKKTEAKMLFSVFLLSSLLQFANGEYTDGDGKPIRQVIQLKKEDISSYDYCTTLLLSCFLGWSGAHHFYTGKPLQGMLMLCSLGGAGFWHVLNMYQLLTCGFKDAEGKVVCPDYIKLSAQN